MKLIVNSSSLVSTQLCALALVLSGFATTAWAQDPRHTDASASAAHSNEDADAVIDRSFFPNKAGPLPLPDGVVLNEGDIIDASNIDQYKELFDPSTYELMKAGDAAPIKVGPLDLELAMHPKYVEASRANHGRVRIVDGNLEGYEGGRPFPSAPREDDPVAGYRLAWNYRHTYAAGEQVAVQFPWIWKYNNMDTGARERELHLQVNFRNFKYRVVHEPIPEVLPNPNNIYRGLYVKAFRPQDVAGTQVLLHLFEDDTRRAAGYIYLGFQRRVRTIDTGQLEDSFLGSDLMFRDFEGYFGPLYEMEWNYLGTKVMLMPVFNHNDQDLSDEYTMWDRDDGYRYIKFAGAGECFLNVTWSPRRVHLLESVPRDRSNPVSRRLHYVDSQSYVMPMNLIYDRAGNLWKRFSIPHSSSEHDIDRNRGEYGASYKGFSIADLQSRRCTTGQKRTELGADVSPMHMFTPQYLREGGATESREYIRVR